MFIYYYKKTFYSNNCFFSLSKMTKAADQGLVDRTSFRFLITGEEHEDHDQFDQSKYVCVFFADHTS